MRSGWTLWGDCPTGARLRTVIDFRKRHLTALGRRFTQVLKLFQKAELVTLVHVAFDSTKLKPNASKHKAMSDGRMPKAEANLAATQRWLEEKAEAFDAREDGEWGRDHHEDELPTRVTDKQHRLEKIRHSKVALEAEAPANAQAAHTRRPDQTGARVSAGAANRRDLRAAPEIAPSG